MRKQIILFYFFQLALACSLGAQNYNWRTIRIGGGGNTTSMYAHPRVENLYFTTTDVGSPYRWNYKQQLWEPILTTNIPKTDLTWGNSVGCGELAFDPNDKTGNILYATVSSGRFVYPGENTVRGTVFKSTDRGNTWKDCKLYVTVYPNGFDKHFRDRLVVDPQNSNIIYLATRSNGSYINDRAGDALSWSKIATPFGDDVPGAFFKFDLSAGKLNGRTKRIYMGAFGKGIYVSNDAGQTFSLIDNSPKHCIRSAITKNGVLYVTTDKDGWVQDRPHETGVYRYKNNTWEEITPLPPTIKGQFYRPIVVNPHNENEIITACSYSEAWGEDSVYISKKMGDKGTWEKLSGKRDYEDVPYEPHNRIGTHINDIVFSPFKKSEVWFCDWYNVYETKNVYAKTPLWKIHAKGHEEIVVTGPMLCPAPGKNVLISTTADVGGFDHKDLDKSPTVGISAFFTTVNGVNTACAATPYKNPNFIVRIGSDGWAGPGIGGYSTDAGTTYKPFKTVPGARGRIAVSADSKKIVWITQNPGIVYVTRDSGNTWQESKGLDKHILKPGSQWDIWAGQNPLASDKVNPDVFYIYHGGKIYKSIDGGNSFKPTAARLPYVGNVSLSNIETVADHEGEVWMSFYEHGLFRSTNGAESFEKINPKAIQNPKWIAVGKDHPNAKGYTIYTSGNVNGIEYGIFKSSDYGKNWKVIAHPYPSVPLNLAADYNGKVFFGTPGNGLYVGEPSK